MMLHIFLLSVLATVGISATPISEAENIFKLTILHNNDIHSRYMETNVYSSPCKSSDRSKCFGGAARSVSLVKKIRNELGRENVLYLNGGDHFQGTIWYNLFKWKAVTDFVINMEYDALTLGNHEFDDGVAGLYPYIDHVQSAKWSNGSYSDHPKTPILVCNLDVSNEPQFNDGGRPIFNNSLVINRNGKDIGLIGYITPDTSFLSSPGNTITFMNEVNAVRKEVEYLKSIGVNIIIVMSHGGFASDINIAKNIPDIDIIVGGHTNTFLYTPGENGNKFDPQAGRLMKAPSIEEPLDEYPKVIPSADGKSKTLIVQAFAYGKYLGYLDVRFDTSGKIVSYNGNPILLDSKIEEDADTLKMMNYWSDLEPLPYKEVIGSSGVFLEGEDIVCRTRECTLGNLYTDMIVSYFMEYFGSPESKYSLYSDSESKEMNGWTKYPIAIINSGMIRTSIAPGEIAREDIMTVLPFKNKLEVVSISGSTLLQVLEHSVSAYDASGQRTEGRFLQFSGLRVEYDIRRPSGDRVINVQVRCGQNCLTPTYEPLKVEQTYQVLTSDYVRSGGDGFYMLINSTNLECPVCKQNDINCPSCYDIDIIEKYVKKWSPLFSEVENRLQLMPSSGSGYNSIHVNLSIIPGMILVLILKYVN